MLRPAQGAIQLWLTSFFLCSWALLSGGGGVKGWSPWAHNPGLLRQLPVDGRGILHPGLSPEQPGGDS